MLSTLWLYRAWNRVPIFYGRRESGQPRFAEATRSGLQAQTWGSSLMDRTLRDLNTTMRSTGARQGGCP